MGYMKFISRGFQKFMNENNVFVKTKTCKETVSLLNQVEINRTNIFSSSLGNTKNRTKSQINKAQAEFKRFVDDLEEGTLMIFSDGSVEGEKCFGNGGCGVVLVRKGRESEKMVQSRPVGKLVENVECETAGIITSLELCVDVCARDRDIHKVIIFTDCFSAIEIVCNQRKAGSKLEIFKWIWKYKKSLDEMNIRIDRVK